MLRRTMLLASAAIAVQSIGAVADPLGDGSFAQSTARLLVSAHPEWVVNMGDDPLSLRIGSTAVYLRNIYLHVQELPPGERDAATVALIEHGLAKNLDTTASLDTLRTSLRLQIAPREYRRATPPIVSRDFMADLMRVYAIDQNERYALLLQPQFEGW
ncbi:hypothetical protein MKK69_26195, partial [Methylobacterium sp. J-026]|uniref:hypothetical protein n=1 Tax=Methylobacterium sp. J-026 TaxID=2836624 RepID=UPI001FBACB7D